jgi:pimeloyl-ACP methyl ester carboxylesterase
MRTGWRVLCPDLLAYGRSSAAKEPEGYAAGSVASDMVALLDALGIQSVHLAAHDYGALVGWMLAAVAPDRLRSFAAFSVGHPVALLDFTFEAMQRQWYLLLGIQNDAPELYRAAGGKLFRELIRSHPDREQITENLLAPGRLEAIQGWDRANFSLELAIATLKGEIPLPPPIEVPTLGVWATEDDYLWESQMEGSGSYIAAEWRYRRLEGAGHWFLLERPDETNALLLDWLGSR